MHQYADINIFNALVDYCETYDWTGPDPFDGLLSSGWPKLWRNHARGRQLLVQLRKRAHWDLGPLLAIPPVRMGKTAGAAGEGLVRALNATGDQRYAESALELLTWVLQIGLSTSVGRAWGYEFDVQTRWAFYPAGTPNIIATVFIGRALLLGGRVLGRPELVRAGVEAARYVATELLAEGKQGPYFRYVPASEKLIHNANLLGVSLLAEAAGEAGAPEVRTDVECAMTSVRAQVEDGAWPYGEGDGLAWCDNFHTAYNLDGLLSLFEAGCGEIEAPLRRGAAYWEKTFFDLDGGPRYLPKRSWPYDVHSAGTAIAVGARLAATGLVSTALPGRVWAWTKRKLLMTNGSFAYQVTRAGTIKIPYMRWGQAHMVRGLGSLLEFQKVVE